jgi:hypothetical protein
MPMIRRYVVCIATTVIALIAVAGPHPALLAEGGSTVGDSTSATDNQIIKDYLDGNWDQVQSSLASALKDSKASNPRQRADLEYIRQTLAECRPPWWKECKAGKKTVFRPMVFSRSTAVTFDPTAKTSIQLNYANGRRTITVFWNASEMDDPDPAEHGFSKGELMNLMVWSTLGSALSLSEVPPQPARNMDAQAQLRLTRYLDFRGNLIAAYYTSPRARRWGLRMDLDAFDPKHAEMSTVLSREATGALFMQEVLGHVSRYPSIHLPHDLEEQGASRTLADYLKNWIQSHNLSFAEDRSLRDAIKASAMANGLKVLQSGIVTLPDGLAIALEPEKDSALAKRRDAWIHAKLSAKR